MCNHKTVKYREAGKVSCDSCGKILDLKEWFYKRKKELNKQYGNLQVR